MIESTRGIVLTNTKYAESSIIAHIYTEKLGLQSYMINQVRSRKNKGKTVFLQPLTLLDLEVYHKEKSTIHRIKDFKVNTPFKLIPFEPIRRSLTFFLAEFLNAALKHEDKQVVDLFDFLHHSISLMDSHLSGIQNFHLLLVFKLTKPLGFYPHFDTTINPKFFDLKSGNFQQTEPVHNLYMNAWQTEILIQLQELKFDQLNDIQLNGNQRAEFIERLIEYYQLHLSGFTNIKSLEILKVLFR